MEVVLPPLVWCQTTSFVILRQAQHSRVVECIILTLITENILKYLLELAKVVAQH